MKKPKLTKQRLLNALKIIEDITIHQQDLPDNLDTDKERELHDSITLIYRIVHTARIPSCFHSHEGWEKEFQELKDILL